LHSAIWIQKKLFQKDWKPYDPNCRRSSACAAQADFNEE